jgi:hypothetical protein
MPILENPTGTTRPPPKPGEAPEPDAAQPNNQESPVEQFAKIRAGRFGELDHHELVHLLDSLDDDRARGRFRESVYISLFIWIAIAWLVLYGPQVLFHQPKFRMPADVLKQRELTELNAPRDIAKALGHAPKAAQPRALDQKTLNQLREQAARPRPAAPTPAQQLPEAPQPAAPPPPQQTVQQPLLPQAPPPQPSVAALPAAPAPSQTAARPNFGSTSTSARDMIRQAGEAPRGGGLDMGGGPSGPVSHRGMGLGGPEILSDTMGVDFDPYLRKIMRQIYNTWIPLIPEEARPPLNKSGETLIRFVIKPDGQIGGMYLDDSTHDDAINKACWGSITGVGQFPPLPSEFHGPNLELRIHYFTNKEPK